MKIVVVGGSSSNVGKTTLAGQLLAQTPREQVWAAMKVSVCERQTETRVLVHWPGDIDERHADSERLLLAGAQYVVWVTVWRPSVRAGLAAGLRQIRKFGADGVVMESTSAGIELHRIDESYFIAGWQPWKPWAIKHMRRANRVILAHPTTIDLGWHTSKEPSAQNAQQIRVSAAQMAPAVVFPSTW